MIQKSLQLKKVLLVLDDVDKREQLQAFVGRPDWFGPGSRVIITTRDRQLLASHGVKRRYEVKVLNENDALQLLTWKAFRKEKADPRYKEVLNDVVTCASGLPLALEVMGSNLFGKSIEYWKSAINKYKRIPDDGILEKLKVSFDALGKEEKRVFLDIACCLKGYKLTEVEVILRALYDDSMEFSIGVLVEKSLVKVSLSGTVELHDLIRDIGRQIDRQESPKQPGKCRRLWLPKDIIQVLKGKTGTSEIEIIYLDFPISDKEETVELDGKAFEKMENLKILIIKNGKFFGGPKCLPNSLRVLEWWGYPLHCLPSDFQPKELAICKLPYSYIESPESVDLSKKSVNLTVLNFDKCKFLTEIPDVSNLPNLEELSFRWCGDLTTVHDSIGFLGKLKILRAEGCSKLMSFPSLHMTCLEKLELSYCSSLENFPEISGKMENIWQLQLHGLPVLELPSSFENLIGLKRLILHCGIVKLRRSIVMMPQLSSLLVSDCREWQWVKSEEGEEKVGSIASSEIYWFDAKSCNLNDDFFSIGFQQFARVTRLFLRGNNFINLPECIKECQSLRGLDVSDCKLLQEIKGIPLNLEYFNAINCKSLTSSSLSMFLNQELHEARSTEFYLPGARIPEWFDHQSRGPSISFCFRNKFPAKVLCLFIAPVTSEYGCYLPDPMVFINGKVQKSLFYRSDYEEVRMLEFDHTYLFDLQQLHFDDDLSEVPLENGWNHVEVTYVGVLETSIIKASGIHVFKEESSMKDIRFTDPNRKRKLDDDLNSSESQ